MASLTRDALSGQPNRRVEIGDTPGQNSTILPKSDSSVSTVIDDEQAASNQATVIKNTVARDRQDATETIDKARGAGQSAGGLQMLRYPANIGQDNIEQPHNVTFSIKVRESSSAGKAFVKNNKDVEYDNNSNNRLTNEEGKNLITLGAGVAGAVVGNRLAKAATGGGNNSVVKGALGLAGAGGGFAAGQALGRAAGDALSPNRVVKTNTTITLHIPTSPSVKYGAQWQEADIGALTGILARSGGDLASLLDTAMTGEAAEFMGRTLAGLSDIPKALGADVNVSGALQAASGKVPNPNKEQLFKSMNFRQFAFDYKFAPRNAVENDAVHEIIKEFKKNMHSERSTEGFFLIYPSEFDIEFNYNSARNIWLHRIKSCALVDLSIVYGSGGTFTTIAGTGGAPSEVTMQMVFKELEVLNKDAAEQGF